LSCPDISLQNDEECLFALEICLFLFSFSGRYFFKTYLFHKKITFAKIFVKQFKLKNMSTKTDAQTISDTTVILKGIRDNREVLSK
jgi:hypothetical protein